MDFVTILLVAVALYLWYRVRSLSERIQAEEQARVRIQQELAAVIAHLTGGPQEAAAAATAPGAALPTVPAAPAAPAAAAMTSPTPPSAALWGPGIGAPPPARKPAGQQRRAPAQGAPPPQAAKPVRVAPPAQAAPPARPAQPSATGWSAQAAFASQPPTVVAPSGPSPTLRLLERLGLTPAEDGSGFSRAALEAWLEGRLLAVVGGIALTLGAVFFLSLAFSRGWITEPMRVLIGLAAGSVAIALGELAFMRVKGILGHVLLAVGLSVVSLSLFAATRLFGLIPPEVGVAGALLAAVVAAAIAIRHDSELVAAFGLISVLAAPPLLGAAPTPLTMLFLAAALVGTTVIALFKTWIWLPPLAFLLAAPQVAASTQGASVPIALLTIAGFWVLNTISAGGEEIRHPAASLRPSTVTLLLASAAFTLWAGTTVLDGAYVQWRGTFVAAVALAYLALGLALLARFGDRHPFGLVVAATGIASITMAVPIQFGATWVPVAWASEAVALTFVATRFRHPYAAGTALLLGAMSLGHLLVVEYPVGQIADGFDRTWPFVGPEGLTFLFLVGSAVVAGLIVPRVWIRVWLAVVGLLTTAYVLPFEASGAWLVGAWSAMTVAGMAAWRFMILPRLAPDFAERQFSAFGLPAWSRQIELAVVALSRTSGVAFVSTVVLLASISLGYLLAVEYPPGQLNAGFDRTWPFVGPEGLAFAFVLGALFLAALIVRANWFRALLGAASIVLTAYVLPFELSGTPLVIAWSALTVASMVAWRFAVAGHLPARFVERNFAAVGLPAADGSISDLVAGTSRIVRPAFASIVVLPISLAIGHLMTFEFPVATLGSQVISGAPYVSVEGLAAAAVIGGLLLMGILASRPYLFGSAGVALMVLTYTLPFEVLPPFVMIPWGLVAVGSLAIVRRLVVVDPRLSIQLTAADLSERVPCAAAAFGLLCMVTDALLYARPDEFFGALAGLGSVPAIPFLDERTFALAALAVTVGVAGWVWGGLTARLVGLIGAAITIAWLLPFEVRPAYAIAGWAALAAGGFGLVPQVPAARVLVGGPSIGLIAFGGFVAIAVVAPPSRLVVDATTTVGGLPILTDATVALGSLAVACAIGARLHRADPLSRVGEIAAALLALYGLSVGLVDVFQRQVGSRPLEDLQREAQLGLSLLWSVLGGIAFAVGIRTRQAPVRLAGLALLGLATAKVFIVDLAALDVAYRVLSLVGLGVLLLVSALVYARQQQREQPAETEA
jgi:uncharacterized membrane protein